MAPDTSLSRTIGTLTQAISTCPTGTPLHDALLALRSPLSAAASLPLPSDVAERMWQPTLRKLSDFADDVIGLLRAARHSRNDSEVRARLASLNRDARRLHTLLNRRGLFTAFSPSFAHQRLWDRVVRCFAQAPGAGLVRDPLLNRNGVDYHVLFRSLDVYYRAVEHLLRTEKTLHHLSEALLRFIAQSRGPNCHICPTAATKCPRVDVTRYANICRFAMAYVDSLQATSISRNDAIQVKKLFELLRFTGFSFKDNIVFDLSKSAIRFPTIGGGTPFTVIYPATLQAQDEFDKTEWEMAVAVKIFIPERGMASRELYFRQEALRINTLAHPSLLAIHDIHWPHPMERPVVSDVLVVTELMTNNLKTARQMPQLESAAARVHMLADVARAQAHLHKAGIAHREITPNNVLLRVCDGVLYGHAKVDVTNLLKQAVFPESVMRVHNDYQIFVPPESLSGVEFFYTGDVWALGILACFLMSDKRSPPDGDVETDAGVSSRLELEAKCHLKKAHAWCEAITDVGVRSLAMECLRAAPEERPNSGRVVKCLEVILDSMEAEGEMGIDGINGGSLGEEDVDDEVLDSSHAVDHPVAGEAPANLDETRGKASDLNQSTCRQSSTPEHNIGIMSKIDSSCAPALSRRRSDEEPSGKDTDWSPTRALKDGERNGSSSSSGVSHEPKMDRKRQPPRKAKEKSRDIDFRLPSPDAKPDLDLVDIDFVAPIGHNKEAVVNDKASVINGNVTPKEISSRRGAGQKTEGEIYIRPDSCDGEYMEKAVSPDKREPRGDGLQSGGLALGDRSGDSRNGKASGGQRDSASFEDEDALYIERQNLHEVKREDPRGSNMRQSLLGPSVMETSSGVETDADKKNAQAEAMQESSRPGCIEEAAKLFKVAADAGSAKAQVNFGHCLEQGRGVEQNFCQAALYFQEAAHQGDSRGQLKIGLCHELGRGTKRDFKVAVEWYKKAADQGNPQAQANLGIALQYGRGIKKDYAKAAALYRLAAEAGNSHAQLNLGVLYESGRGVNQDPGTAVNLYEKAAAGGNNRAMLNMALCYERGYGVRKDILRAAQGFMQAADCGNIQAQFRAAQCFEKGDGVKRNITKAAYYYQSAASNDHIAAMCSLGVLYEEGRGVACDKVKAFKLFKAASEEGHASATVRLALCYEHGIGVKKSPTSAVHCYKLAAHNGNAQAKVALGYMYENGAGVKRSTESAVQLYREAAAAGFPAGEAALGQCYYFGYGMTKSMANAVRLFQSASEKGDPTACVELGNLYRDGSEVEQDYSKAFDLYERAAAKGNTQAQINCGECHYYGRGTVQDYDKAVKLFKRAADQGSEEAGEAYRWLGDCFSDGNGVEVDMKQAVEYYRLGAAAGNTCAQTSLGCCYENGQGVEVNGPMALHFYKKAADKQNTTAMNNLGILYEKGKCVKQDYAKAFKLYKKAVSMGHLEALCNLADCYAGGNGVQKDLGEAVKLYKEGASQGLAGAQCELGYSYYYGRGVELDDDRAVQLFREASTSEPEAVRNLGTAYFDGCGVAQDCKKALKLYFQAVQSGNTDAYLNIGLCYEQGNGVDRDYKKAAEFYSKAMEGGNLTAMRFLGNLYSSGLGVEQDYSKAMDLYEASDHLTLEEAGQ